MGIGGGFCILGWLDVHLDPGTQHDQAVHDDLVLGGQSFDNRPQRTVRATCFDLSSLRLAIGVHDIHVFVALV